MPLRQTLLHFTSALTGGRTTSKLENHKNAMQRTASSISNSSSSSAAHDTITVDISEEHARVQLPTPSETATDASSQTSEKLQITKARSKRVRGRRNNEPAAEDDPQLRTVSGETLVDDNEGSVKSSSATNTSEDAKPSWSNADSVVSEEDVIDVEISTDANGNDEEEQEEEDEIEETPEEARQRRAALKAKIEENARIREQKAKEADAKATRRSSRGNILSRAGDLVSDIAASVLGKRKDRSSDDNTNSRPASMIEPDTKKQRTTEPEDLKDSRPLPRKALVRRDKRWLISGLYAGQTRAFDGRLTESKNKKKAAQDVIPPRENTVIPLPMFAGERLLKIGRDFKLPFDVFSPLPAGQPKPDEWRKTNKNVFVGDAATEWRTSKFVEHSTCMCRSETGCDHNCMNRFMYYECDDKNCNLTEEQCANRPFEGLKQRCKKGGKYNAGVEVIKTVDRGYGVRSNRTFEPNQIIVEYTGEIINQEECETRMRTIYKDNECYYLMLFDQNMIIDATRGSIARFVNHSCEPNCRMEKWTVGGKPRMALFAGERGIMTGEELTYDYNFDPYSQKNVQQCRCGAKSCRGILGPRPKEKQKGSEEMEDQPKMQVKSTGSKKKTAQIKDQPSLSKTAGKGKISSPARKSSNTSPTGVQKRAKLIKQALTKTLGRGATSALADDGLVRQPSKLKKTLNQVKDKAGSNRRIVSTSSASRAIIKGSKLSGKQNVKATTVIHRSSSMRSKGASLRKNIAGAVRSARSAHRNPKLPSAGTEMDVDVEIEEEIEIEMGEEITGV